MHEAMAQQDNRLLKERQILFLICHNFKISGHAKLLLTFNDLLRVQLKNDNVQGFYTKWDGVLLSMTQVPDEDLLENMYKKQLRFSEEWKPLMVLDLQRTVQKGEATSFSRLKEMVRRHVEKKIREAVKTGLFTGQQPGKETQEEIL